MYIYYLPILLEIKIFEIKSPKSFNKSALKISEEPQKGCKLISNQ